MTFNAPNANLASQACTLITQVELGLREIIQDGLCALFENNAGVGQGNQPFSSNEEWRADFLF